MNPRSLCLVTMLCVGVNAPTVRAQWINYRAPGVPRTADGKVNLAAPMPRTPDGRPDLSGTWLDGGGYWQSRQDLKPGEFLMLPWAQKLVDDREKNLHNDDLLVQCLPEGVPRINMSASRGMPHPFKIVQTPSLVVLLYETSGKQTFRQIFLDGRPLPKDRSRPGSVTRSDTGNATRSSWRRRASTDADTAKGTRNPRTVG